VKPSVVTGERVASLPHGCISSITHRLGETGIVLKRPVVAIVEQARKGTLRLHIPTCFGNLKDGCKLGNSGSSPLGLVLESGRTSCAGARRYGGDDSLRRAGKATYMKLKCGCSGQ